VTIPVRTTTRNWLEIVHEADPDFEKKKRKVKAYEFTGRIFYDKIDPYSGTSTST